MNIQDLDKEMFDRITRVLRNEDFRKLCLQERKNIDFDDIFKNSFKIANIDVSKINENQPLISNVHLFTLNQIKNDVLDFFTMLDNLDKSGVNLTDRVKENSKYVRLKPRIPDERSFCMSGIDKNGNKHREIFINLEGRIGDTSNAIHELCHSCCTQYIDCIRPRDSRVGEIPTIITDQLSSRFLKKKYPQFAENFLEYDKFMEKQNVKKARECVFDTLLIMVVCGEMTLTEVFQNYGNMFSDFPDILFNKLKEIETGKYKPFYEYSYLIPQAIALEMRERFRLQPELVAKQLKHIIADNHKLTEEQILDYLGLPQKDQLIDDYVSKFQNRMKQIDAEQEVCQENSQLHNC